MVVFPLRGSRRSRKSAISSDAIGGLNPTFGEVRIRGGGREPQRAPMGEITRLLRSAATGDAGARDALFAVAYPGLEKLARARLRDGGRNTLLDTRGLVHESYLR